MYGPARAGYQQAANREQWAARRGLQDTLRPFVPHGGLVFDIGANHGEMTDVFLALGARVVAVEPNPELAALIVRRYRTRRLTVEACAVGARCGTGALHLGADDGHSTLSEEWRDIVPDRWVGEIAVPIRTLDDLIHEHGRPDFVKIDVEGLELDALAGLSAPVAGLSFEFRREMADDASACMTRLLDLGPYRFAGQPPAWKSAGEVLADIEAVGPGASGDIYALHG